MVVTLKKRKSNLTKSEKSSTGLWGTTKDWKSIDRFAIFWMWNCKKRKSKLKRNVERYLVDYVKMVIKSKKGKGREKFLSLNLLKDLIKKKHQNLISYNAKKLLDRLYDLANSSLKERVLTTYVKGVNMEYSKKFYHLLLECFEKWKPFCG